MDPWQTTSRLERRSELTWNPGLVKALTTLSNVALLGGTVLGAPAVASELALVGVTHVDVRQGVARADQTVLVEEDRITAVGPRATVEIPPSAREIDGRGLFVMPGLWDMHVHLANRDDWQLATRSVRLHLAHGVVGVRDMGSDFEQIERLRQEMTAGRLDGPTIVAAGPFIDGAQEASAVVFPVADAEEARGAVRQLEARGVDFIKVQAKLSQEAYLAIAAEAKTLGLPFAGHVPDVLNGDQASDAGQRSIEHLSPALPSDASLLLASAKDEPSLRQELLALEAAARDPDTDRQAWVSRRRALQRHLVEGWDKQKAEALFRRLSDNGTWVTPTLVWSLTYLPRGQEDIEPAIPLQFFPKDAVARWQERRRAYVEQAGEETLALNRAMAQRSLDLVALLKAADVPVLAGTDSYDAFVLPGFSLHQELELLVRAGLTPSEALATATFNAAAYLEQTERRGTIEKGKVADLVLLRANPLEDIRNTRAVEAVVQAGRYWSRQALDELLSTATP